MKDGANGKNRAGGHGARTGSKNKRNGREAGKRTGVKAGRAMRMKNNVDGNGEKAERETATCQARAMTNIPKS